MNEWSLEPPLQSLVYLARSADSSSEKQVLLKSQQCYTNTVLLDSVSMSLGGNLSVESVERISGALRQAGYHSSEASPSYKPTDGEETGFACLFMAQAAFDLLSLWKSGVFLVPCEGGVICQCREGRIEHEENREE